MSQNKRGHIDTKHESPELSEELANNSPTSRQAGNPLLTKVYEVKDAIFGNSEYTSLTQNQNIDAKSRPIQEDKFPQSEASKVPAATNNLLSKITPPDSHAHF